MYPSYSFSIPQASQGSASILCHAKAQACGACTVSRRDLAEIQGPFFVLLKIWQTKSLPSRELTVVAGRVCRVKHVVSCCCCCFHVRLLLVWLGALTPSIHEQKDAGKAHAACRNAYVSVTSRVRFGHCKIGRSPEKRRKRTICFLPQEMMVDTECAQLLCQKVTGFGAVKCEADICRNE